jgi:hypothetical protein
MKVLSDHEWVDPNGYRFGIFLFDHFGILAGVDVYAIDAPTVPDRLPTIVELERYAEVAAQPAVAAADASQRR